MKRVRQILLLASLLCGSTAFAQKEDIITIITPSKKVETTYASLPRLINGKDDYQFSDAKTTLTFAKSEKIVIIPPKKEEDPDLVSRPKVDASKVHRKMIKNNRLIIEKDGKQYDANGIVIK